MATFVVRPQGYSPQSDALGRLLTEHGREAVMAPSLEDVRQHSNYGKGKCFVFVLDTLDDASLADEVLRFAETEGRRAFLIYVGNTMSADTYKRLVRARAGEWIRWDSLAQEVGEIFHANENEQSETSNETATIVSFLPAKGGVGNTTIAVEIGVCLASSKKRDRRVAVVDLNFHSSTLADYLDVEPRFDISEISGRPERLDAQLVEVLASKHPTQVDIFSSPSRLTPSPNIQDEVIFALLDEIGKKYSFVLLDLPNYWYPWFNNVLQGSSAVVVTGEGTVPSIRQIANKQKYLDDLSVGTDRAVVVVNSCSTDFLGRITRKSEIDRTFSGRQIFYVPRDTSAAVEAANTGRSIIETAPRRRICKDIRKLGVWIEALAAPPSKSF